MSATAGDRKGVFAVGGYVGSEQAWTAVEAEWKEGLKTFELSEFHLADIAQNLGHEMGGLCIMHFSRIIGRSSLRSVGASCDVGHWRARDTGYDNPYHFCFSMALHVLREDIRLQFGGEPVALVVDDDVQPHDVTEAVFAAYQNESRDTFASLAFGNRRRFLPLQCADLAIGALRKEWLEGFLSNNKAVIREFFGALGSARFMHFSAETERVAREALARIGSGD